MKYMMTLLLTLSFSAQAITFKEWQKLTDEAKIEYLDYESAAVSADVDAKKVISTTLTPARQAKLKSKIASLLSSLHTYQTEMYTEVEDDYHGIVGKVARSADLHFSSDNIFLGANIHYFQQGCSHQDAEGNYLEEGGYYETIEEANKNNCFDNDVSWSANSIVNELVSEIYNSEFMEWSGH